jgi:3',5'-cyclic-AMP phosphodiesterase
MDDQNVDGGRRRLLECMGWAGTGAVFALAGGIPHSTALGAAMRMPTARGLSFVQISDSHIGFNKAANPDPIASLKQSIAAIKALPQRPDFVIHTGDITHLATPAQFDMAQQLLSGIGAPVHYVAGEHDIVDGNDPRPFLDRFGKGSKGNGWYSFDAGGVHFVALVNAIQLGDRGMGMLGTDQLIWLKDDLAAVASSTPVVVYSHFPLWELYPDWGWGTADAAEALALLKRFGSVTALNGHVHQVQQRVESHMSFHSARSTAYPQPAPGQGDGPGPLIVPAGQLASAIGIRTAQVTRGPAPIALIDRALVSA